MRSERQFLFWIAALAIAVASLVALREVLLPFVVGLILAYALNPIADMLVRRGLSRLAASALVVVLIVILLALAVLFLVPPLVAQLQQLGQTLPTVAERLRALVEELARERLGEARFAEFKAGLDQAVAGMSLNWSTIIPAVLTSLWSRGLAVMNFVSLLLITPLVVFYLLVDWHPMIARIDGWLPRAQLVTIRRLAGDIDAAISAFVRGQGLVCLVLGAVYAIGLSWAGLRYGLLIGLATGLSSFVPFAGWAMGLIVAAVMMLVQSWPDLLPLYKVIAVFLAGMVLDSAVLSPRIVGQRVGLHPLWLIFALFVFSYAMGFVGMLVAVPLAAAFAVLVRYGIEVYLASKVYRGHTGSVDAATSDGTASHDRPGGAGGGAA